MNRKWILYLGAAATCTILAATGGSYARQTALQHGIAEKVLRFHVLANSDSDRDQCLKLEVRDAVGSYMQEKLTDAGSFTESEQIVAENLPEIERIAEEILTREGCHDAVVARLEETSFPVKQYGDYTFPAGNYEALRVVIGEGKGHNWWCVMYPNLCFENSIYEVVGKDAGGKLQEVLSPEEYEKVLEDGNYHIECKYLSFLNGLWTK